ncbi:hypothetical protein [Streptomyces noursei]|uniref:hypothetical protein n=1 Tax=Streptomyces noursei TaxID=1971 RepID=UPI001965AE6E|nr:hypothetical protein [Streptomyces noursei]QRX89931.1 hypothetical protein JNO44_02805 [Streptomyces noursei]
MAKTDEQCSGEGYHVLQTAEEVYSSDGEYAQDQPQTRSGTIEGWPAANAPSSDAQSIRYATRRATSFEPSHTYQQSLQFELIEEAATPNVRRRGRAVRISTRGTVVDTARIREHHDAGSGATTSYSYLAGRFAPGDLGKKRDLADNGNILDSFAISVQPVTPTAPAGTTTQNSADWVISDFSPTSHNGEKTVSTSTTIGANVGFFGTTPTAGLSYSYTTGASWALKDYELAAAGSTTHDGPYVSWSIKRTSKDSDPALAKSALTPHLEAVFTLRPEANPSRFSAFTVLTTITTDHVTTEKRSIPWGPWLLGYLIAPSVEVKVHHWVPIQFLQTYLIDWEYGTVEIIGHRRPRTTEEEIAKLLGLPLHPQRPNLMPVPDHPLDGFPAIISRLVRAMSLVREKCKPTADDVKAMFSPVALPTVKPDLTGRFRYRGESPVGTMFVPPGRKTIEIAVPAERLGQYVNGFAVGSTDPAGSWSYEWLGFRRSLLITRTGAASDGCTVWLTPRNYRGGVCTVVSPNGLNQLPVRDLGLPEPPDAIVGLYPDASKPAKSHVVFWRDCVYQLEKTGTSTTNGAPVLRLAKPRLLREHTNDPATRDVDTAYSFPEASGDIPLKTTVVLVKGQKCQAFYLAADGTLTPNKGEPLTQVPKIVTALGGRLDTVLPRAFGTDSFLWFGGRLATQTETIEDAPKPVPFEKMVARSEILRGRLSPDFLFDSHTHLGDDHLFFHAPGSYVDE